jgi:hypothetical protein
MTNKVYDPNQLSVIFGVTPINGFAEDTMLSIDVEDPQYNVSTDIHGSATRFKVNKNLAKITITLTQSSPSNDVLSSYVEADRINNSGVFPIMIKDTNGTSLFSSTSAYIEQVPSVEFGNESKTREWVIRATNIVKFIGGIK